MSDDKVAATFHPHEQPALMPIPAPWQPGKAPRKPRWSRHQGSAITCDDCTIARASGTVTFPQMPARWKVQTGQTVRYLCTVHAKRRWK